MTASAGTPGRITTYEHDGLRFDVRDEGPLDGDVVVLLHGFPERSTSWRDVVPALHAAGLRTIAPDQRGYSPGARPRRRRAYRSALLTADVAALVERIGGPVHLVGHDWGAAIAWSVTTARPDLVRTLTAFSVPHPTAYLRAMATTRQARDSWYMYFFQLPRLPERTLSRRGGRGERWLADGGLTPADLERFRTEIVEYGALRGGLGWYRAMLMLDRSQLGRKVRVPTTMVWSDQDAAISRPGVDLCARYVDAPYELVVLEGVDHWIPTHAPRAAVDAILARTGRPSAGAA
ncbi:alpha/beta fold hydrolase [Nocardioides sp. HDW12B]|uniref:alpha/beta fold hydrolase n=1 Tax=Nocardioides sp. HDW12B TaxID=2714939 RepID=UPI001407C4C6|nr:alpha/beta fold hydrolase [Nocardioides sp. HDW12B]QIK68114.1 alpha/beta fold hydrolase [Nocardioides sp. HDW12B]